MIPRELPRGYSRRTLLIKNTRSMIGLCFILITLPAVFVPVALLMVSPFFLSGIFLLYTGLRQARKWLSALHHGTATRGTLSAVQEDLSQSADHKHPWRIEFTFELHGGGTEKGFVTAWDPVHAKRTAGDHVWVVYSEADPTQHALWPPVR